MRTLRRHCLNLICCLALALAASGPAVAAVDGDVPPWSAVWESISSFFNPFAGTSGTGGAPRNVPAEKPEGPPSIVAAERTFDFGTVPASGTVTHDFIVRNQGPGELIIKNVSPG
ncbi:MAG: DUF1573 domain-containing protein [Pseudomonadota bacterium]